MDCISYTLRSHLGYQWKLELGVALCNYRSWKTSIDLMGSPSLLSNGKSFAIVCCGLVLSCSCDSDELESCDSVCWGAPMDVVVTALARWELSSLPDNGKFLTTKSTNSIRQHIHVNLIYNQANASMISTGTVKALVQLILENHLKRQKCLPNISFPL